MISRRYNVTSFTYDNLNRQVTRTDPLGNTYTTVYDANNNVIRTIDPTTATHTFTYDNLDRLTVVEEPTGNVFTTVYDLADRVTNTIDAVGTTTYVWDVLDRLTSETDLLGNTTTYLYDKLDNLTGLIDPLGNRTTFVRDALNRVVEETDPLNNTSYVDYDLDDNVTSVTDRLGRVRALSYDANGRQVGESWLNGTVTVDALLFDYDDAGNLLSAGDSSATYDYDYDALNRVTNVSGPFGITLTHSYDAVGNRTRTEDNFGGVITSTYNDANLLSMRQFSDGASTLRFDQDYNDRNQLEEVTRYSNLAGTTKVGESDYAYDDQGRLENINHKNGSDTTLAELTYTYDALNRLKTEVLDGTTKTFTYDERSQLLDDGVTSYSYDDNGNRDMAGYQTTTGNRMTNDGTFTYTYDAEGNTIKKSKGASLETWVYEYDFRNQLIDIEKQETDGGTVLLKVEYEYDVFGRRIQEDKWTSATGTVTTKFAYDGANVWAELDDAEDLQTRYVRPDGIDALAARIDSGGVVAWYLVDHLGSVIGLTDSSGVVQDRIYYDGFGNITSETNAAYGGQLKFTGKDFDSDTRLQHNWTRYYDPATGRWTTIDFIRFRAGDANLYRYVGNNPTNATDPSGQIFYKSWWRRQGKKWRKVGNDIRRGRDWVVEQGEGAWVWSVGAARWTGRQVKSGWYWSGDQLEAGWDWTRDWFVSSASYQWVDRNWTRVGGGLQLTGGLALGIFAIPASFFGGIPIGFLAADQSSAGLNKLWHGDEARGQRTLTSRGISELAELLTDDPRQAVIIGETGDLMLNLFAGLNWLTRGPQLIKPVRALPFADEVACAKPVPRKPTCFPECTLVSTAAGQRPIQELQQSDLVWAYDVAQDAWSLRPVVKTLAHEFDGELVSIQVAQQTIQATPNHPFWVVSGSALQLRPHLPENETNATKPRIDGRWVAASDLHVGDVLLSREHGERCVESVSFCYSRGKVYNLEVEGLNNFTVGEHAILVHNKRLNRQPRRGMIDFSGPSPQSEVLSPAHLRILDEGEGFKTFTELKNHLGPPPPDHAWHHIVGQNADNIERFGAEFIQNTANVIAIPHGKGSVHLAKIEAFLNSHRPEITGHGFKRVRDWLKTKSYQYQYEFGVLLLRELGVTLP